MARLTGLLSVCFLRLLYHFKWTRISAAPAAQVWAQATELNASGHTPSVSLLLIDLIGSQEAQKYSLEHTTTLYMCSDLKIPACVIQPKSDGNYNPERIKLRPSQLGSCVCKAKRQCDVSVTLHLSLQSSGRHACAKSEENLLPRARGEGAHLYCLRLRASLHRDLSLSLFFFT